MKSQHSSRDNVSLNGSDIFYDVNEELFNILNTI